MNSGAGTHALRIEVDGWTIDALSDGTLRLDGGAMWGVVPASLWRALTPPDEDNTIEMALRPFLARKGEHVVLIEGGVGARWSDKLRGIYRIQGGGSLGRSLRDAGVEPEAVTHVVMSHCHWDHVGALVEQGDRGPRLLCPRARHFAPAVEVERCLDPDHVRRGSYRPEDLAPIVESGQLETWTGVLEPLPGLLLHELGGHSDGVSVVTLGPLDAPGPGRAAVFWSDVVPTGHHVQPAYIMAYDIDVVRSFEVRSQWLARAAEQGWIGLFYHDPELAFGRLVREGRRYFTEPISP